MNVLISINKSNALSIRNIRGLNKPSHLKIIRHWYQNFEFRGLRPKLSTFFKVITSPEELQRLIDSAYSVVCSPVQKEYLFENYGVDTTGTKSSVEICHQLNATSNYFDA